MGLSEWAEEQGERLLAPLGRRWTHSRAVAERARDVGDAVPGGDRELLLAAAYLHDVGYADSLALVGFHPVDGARWLTHAGHDRLAGLVAHHSGSKHEAAVRGLSAELVEFDDEGGLVAAALAYCDLTTGPGGELMTPEERRAEVESRHGFDSPVSLGLRRAWPDLMAAVATIEERLGEDRARQPM